MKTNLIPIDEATLVGRCRRNDAAAQHELYGQYVEGMMVLCLRYIKDHELAKEVLMDGFLNGFRHIDSFSYSGEGSVRAWLKKIMVNQCLMQLRKRQLVFVPHSDDSSTDANTDNVLDDMNARQIMTMIHALPDGCRTVFNLYVFEGMNHREIAAALGISDSTSKSQLHRARTLLKEKILQTS